MAFETGVKMGQTGSGCNTLSLRLHFCGLSASEKKKQASWPLAVVCCLTAFSSCLDGEQTSSRKVQKGRWARCNHMTTFKDYRSPIPRLRVPIPLVPCHQIIISPSSFFQFKCNPEETAKQHPKINCYNTMTITFTHTAISDHNQTLF